MASNKHYGAGSAKPQLPDDGVLRIYSMRFCPFAHRVHLVLDAKKIPYHSIFINLSNKPEWLTEFSALGKVPALELVKEVGRPTLIESLIIADYLDEKYPERPLYPKDPLKKAQDRIMIERFSAVIGSMYKVFVGESSPGSLTDISNALDIFEQELRQRGTTYFGGSEEPGMLDYMIWPWCERSAMLKHLLGEDKYELDRERFGLLLKWRDLMINDSAVKNFYLDGETHAKFMRSRREGKADYDMLV